MFLHETTPPELGRHAEQGQKGTGRIGVLRSASHSAAIATWTSAVATCLDIPLKSHQIGVMMQRADKYMYEGV